MEASDPAHRTFLERRHGLTDGAFDHDAAWRRVRLAVYGLTAAVYGISLTSPFQFDDRGMSLDVGGLRPMVKLSFGLSRLFGDSLAAFHGLSLLIHLVNVGLVLRVVQLVAPRRTALAAAALFALHPIHTEAVTYVSARPSLLSTTFMLLALLSHAEGVRTQRRLLLWVAAPAAFILAVLSKETALVLPLGLLTWDALVERAQRRQLFILQAPWWIAGVAVFGFMLSNDHYFALLYRVVGQRALRDATVHQLAGLSYLASRLLLIGRPCIDPGLWTTPSTTAVVGGAATLVALIGVAAWQHRARPAVSFGLVWFLLHAFVPYLLVSRVDVINERHAYVADFGLFLALGVIWAEWPRFARRVVAGLAIAALSLLTVVRNREYRDEVNLWQSTVREAPENPRAWNNLGVAHEIAHDLDAAHSAYLHAVLVEPRYTPARENLDRTSALLRRR